MATTVENSWCGDIIDSRDIIARIDELESERSDLSDAVTNEESAAAIVEDDDGSLAVARKVLADWDEEYGEELAGLKSFADECEGYGDWAHGEGLIADSYFTEYAQELAEDIGAIGKDLPWPACHIDWEAASDALKQDYMSVELFGNTYWMRA